MKSGQLTTSVHNHSNLNSKHHDLSSKFTPLQQSYRFHQKISWKKNRPNNTFFNIISTLYTYDLQQSFADPNAHDEIVAVVRILAISRYRVRAA